MLSFRCVTRNPCSSIISTVYDGAARFDAAFPPRNKVFQIPSSSLGSRSFPPSPVAPQKRHRIRQSGGRQGAFPVGESHLRCLRSGVHRVSVHVASNVQVVIGAHFLQEITRQRRDLGNLLLHFTRQHPRAVLEKIASEGRLLGGSGFIKGGHHCVCFTETPISEIPTVLRLAKRIEEAGLRPRYEPYGVAVRKEWLFAQGGRPVIYQPDSEYDLLPPELRYRHVRYEPGAVDFTWEREWRIKANELKLDPKQTLFILPTADEAFDFAYGHASLEGDDYDDVGMPRTFYHEARWLAVSLDLFGLDLSSI